MLRTIKGTVYDRSFIRDSSRLYHVIDTDGLEPNKWYYIQLQSLPFDVYRINRFVLCQ